MTEGEAKANERAEKIKVWLKDPSNLLISLIVIFAFVLHIYYLNMASGQTLWWDEAEYMATAKHWALDIPYTLNPQRPPLFQLSAAFLIRAGLDEFALKFLLIILPATALIYFTYLLGKELFDKKTGLFAALASAGMWSYLFWGARFQPDFLSLAFQVLSLFFFWRMFKNNNSKDAILGGIFAAAGFYFKISALLIPLIIGIFAFWKDRSDTFKKKIYWQAGLAFIISMVPFMLWQYSFFGSPLEFAKSYGVEGGSSERPLGWQALDFFTIFPKELFFILFCAGIISALIYLGLRFDIILKEKEKRTDPRIFSIISLVCISAFYVFYIQGVIEDRWVFLITPFIFIFAAQGVFALLSIFKINKKEIQILIILVLFVIFFNSQLNHAGNQIKSSSGSYAPVKEAALWIKDHTGYQDKVVSASYTQMTAYAEREVLIFSPCPYVCSPYKDELEFDKALREKKPKYVMFSIFEGHPPWIFQKQEGQQEKTKFVAWIMPYVNSTIIMSESGQVLSFDLKQNVQREGITLTLVYPTNQINGVFIYELKYD